MGIRVEGRLGGLLNGPQSNAPLQAPAPQARAQVNPIADIVGTQPGPRESNFTSMLQHPAVMAALAQSAASMLSQRGIFPSLGDATGAAGRALTTLEKNKQREDQQGYDRQQDAADNRRADEALEIRRRAAERAAARSGGKATSSSDKLFQMLMEAEKARYKGEVDTTMPGQAPPPPPDPLLIRQEAEQIASLSPEDSGMYLQLRREGGAESARLYLEWVQAGKPGPTPVTAPAEETAPAPSPTPAPTEIQPTPGEARFLSGENPSPAPAASGNLFPLGHPNNPYPPGHPFYGR